MGYVLHPESVMSKDQYEEYMKAQKKFIVDKMPTTTPYDTVFLETDEPRHEAELIENDAPCSGWVTRDTYLASVRQLTAVNRCITEHLRTVVWWLAVSVAGNIVLAFWVVGK